MRVQKAAILLSCCCCLATALTVHAQPLRGTVVIAAVSGAGLDAITEQAADRVEAALRERPVGIIGLHEARDRFVALSRPPTRAEEGDVDVLAREARAALEHVAFGRTQAAQKSVKQVLSLAERALESLNRDTVIARQVLDACLALVRSELHRGDRSAALMQAASCRRLVPDVSPNQSLHPANVIGALAEADDQMRRLRTGRLQVTSKPEASCSVYVNGRHLGTTPFALERAVPGQYRVQVECSAARGRVHMLTLGDTPVELSVDSLLDRSVRIEPRLHFDYGNQRVSESLSHLHAMEAARLIGAEQVVQLRSAGGAWVLSRLTVSSGRLVGRARIKKGDPLDRDELARAVEALWEGRIDDSEALAGAMDVTEPALSPRAEPPADGLPGPPSSTRPRVESLRAFAPKVDTKRWLTLRRGLGLGAAAIAAATWLSGLVFERQMDRRNGELTDLELSDSRVSGLQRKYARARELRWVGLGGALGVLAVPVLSAPRREAPWWGYAISAVGAGVLGLGLVDVVRSDECVLTNGAGACIQQRDSGGQGALLVTLGLPLLSVLPTQLLWERPAEAPELSARADRHSFVLALTLRGAP